MMRKIQISVCRSAICDLHLIINDAGLILAGRPMMSTQKISLNDRYDLDKSPVLLNGTQALVRLMLMQKARDVVAGLNTAGLCDRLPWVAIGSGRYADDTCR